ncbi:MAG: hypothetical protein F2667_00270 [Actinobacteria bacterium]|nr:hypothetical protein [Actinomycetota bacterium]
MRLSILVEERRGSSILGEVAYRLENPRPLLQVLGEDLVAYEAEVFATEGNGAWPALSPATLKAKNGGRVLVDTGRLLAGLTSNSAIDVGTDDVTVTASHPAAGYLKRGTSKMPARDPAPAPPARVTGGWARSLLSALVEGHRR